MAVDYCHYLLEELEPIEQQDYFSGNCKKDDLADSYLQAMYYLDKTSWRVFKEIIVYFQTSIISI